MNIFTLTNTNIRYAHSSSEKMILSGDHFSVGETIGTEQRAKLQNCFAQFQQYGALLKPLMSGMNTMNNRLNPNTTTSKKSSSHMSSEKEENTKTSSHDDEERNERSRNNTTRRRHSKTRKNRVKFEDEKIKRERGKRRHQRGRYKPTKKLWDMLDELEEVKSRVRK